MMISVRIVAAFSLAALAASAQETERDFSGNWQLSPTRSAIHSNFEVPSGVLRIIQNASYLVVSAGIQEGDPWLNLLYPLSGRPERSYAGPQSCNIVASWSGAALRVKVTVGSVSYSELWVRSKDGNTLTITRTPEGAGGPIDSFFVYEKPNGAAVVSERREPSAPFASAVPAPFSATGTLLPRSQLASASTPAPPGQAVPEFVLEPGTRVLLRLTNAVNTATSAPGDRLYLQTAMPVFQNGRIVIPQGSYVMGTVTESARAGRVAGKSALNLRFESLTLPNGVTRDFRFRAGSVGDRGNLDRSEGKITGQSAKGKDAMTVAKTASAGAALGGIVRVGDSRGAGVGIGAAAGAIAGLAGVLSSRGPEIVIPQGTTMEMVLDRELRFTETELSTRAR